MKTGSQVYSEIEGSVKAAQSVVSARSQELAKINADLQSLSLELGQSFRGLAGVRLEELDHQRIHERLDAADHEAIDLLAKRDRTRESLNQSILESQAKQTELTENRLQILNERDDATEARDLIVQQVLKALQDNEDFKVQHAQAQATASLAQHASAKAKQAESDRVEKGKPFESCKLFSYLWKRRFRFPEYDASPLIRTLDGWVAGLCDYDKAHRDYAMLLQIPDRLRAHAQECEREAEEEQDKEDDLTEAAMAEAGVPARDDLIVALDAKLQQAEETLEREEDRHRELNTQRAAIDAGTDSWSVQARNVLEERMRAEELVALRLDANVTETHRDDLFVGKISDLRVRESQYVDARTKTQEAQQEALKRVADLEEVRRRFRRERFDSSNSRFNNSLNVGGLLGGLAKGAVVLIDVLEQMRRNQRFERRHRFPHHRQNPLDYGSLGGSIFGKGSVFGNGSIFGGGSSSSRTRTRHRPPPTPRPRRRRSGGGGGGGFRTGGGF